MRKDEAHVEEGFKKTVVIAKGCFNQLCNPGAKPQQFSPHWSQVIDVHCNGSYWCVPTNVRLVAVSGRTVQQKQDGALQVTDWTVRYANHVCSIKSNT